MSNSDELITSVGKNSNDTAALVWSVADDLVGAYKPHEYGLVILPMTVIKRFHDCLLPTHQAVLDTYKKPVADTSKRDTENVPLAEDIDAYFEREVIPYNPQAWIDKAKTKVGYEIPFTRTFYEYKQIEPSDVIAVRIEEHEKSLMAKLHDLFGGE